MIFGLLLLLIIPIVVAQQESIRFYHETGINLTIYEKCRIDGATCDSDFNCSITVLSPDQALIINNQTMDGPAVYYNFTLNKTQTSDNGIHEATIDCTNGTSSGSNTFFYQNTPNGSVPIDEGQSLIIFGGVFLVIIISFCIGWMGFRLQNGAVWLSLISFSVLLFVFALGMITNIFQLSFGTFGAISDNFSSIYILFTILVGVGAFALIVWLIVFSLKLYWQNRGMVDKEL